MINEVKTLIVKPKRTWMKIAAAVIIGLIIIGLGMLKYKGVTPSEPAKPRPISHRLDTCAVTKEGNPLVESLSVKPDVVQGTLKGKIAELKFDKVLSAHVIKLVSLDNQQSYIFTVVDQKGLFSATKGEASASALQTNQILNLSFTCDTKSTGFKFTKVLIL